MKGYEAARRNMALMYMRSERSDLNLRMSQVSLTAVSFVFVAFRMSFDRRSEKTTKIIRGMPSVNSGGGLGTIVTGVLVQGLRVHDTEMPATS